VSTSGPAPRPISLRRWLTIALLCIAALPPLTVWVAHLASAGDTGPSARTLAAARGFAIDTVTQWNDPLFRTRARAYFAGHRVSAQLRPAGGPWLTAGPAPARVPPADKFLAREPGRPSVIMGSGWVVPRLSARSGWTLPLTAGILVLAVTVAATGAFLGRHVIRPLAAIGQAARAMPGGAADLFLPVTRVGEVSAVAAALQTMSGNLHAALDRQADLEEQRRQFIGAIAHDLRTPVFTLRAYLDGLSDGLATSPEKTGQYLQACRTSATALDRLITDLFSYASMEYLDQQPRREPVDLGALLRTAAAAHQPRAEARHITLAVTEPAGPCPVTGDEHLLTRAIGNLLDNALRHTPEHGRIDLRCSAADQATTFTISDTGPGIGPADLPHLFTPLYRGETSRNRASGGAGLGLTIAHRIVAAHGGTLTAGNVSPHGACFTARIPAVVPPAELNQL
jgi:signal transduction histidine kinase